MTHESRSRKPLVSVVIPTYYRNERLDAAIESVHAQTHDPIETIVVDGSGDEHARPVAEAHGVRYIAQERDEGPHAARSEGAEAANGKYVNFLDDDDRLHPEKLTRQLAVFETRTVGVVYCGIVWENGHVVLPDLAVEGDVLEYALMFQMTPSSPSAMLIDTAVLADMLPLANRHGADDMGMKIELATRTEFAFVDEVLVTKGDSDDSLGGSAENVAGRLHLLSEYAHLYERHPPRVRRVALAHTHLLAAETHLDGSAWSPRAVTSALRACYHVPGLPLSFGGYLLASLFGRPGRDLGRRAYDRFVLGNEHRGKVT